MRWYDDPAPKPIAWTVVCDTPIGAVAVDITDRLSDEACRRARWHLVHARNWNPTDVRPMSCVPTWQARRLAVIREQYGEAAS